MSDDYLIDYLSVFKVYEDELKGIYDKDSLDNVLSFFCSRFELYATKWMFHPNIKITRKVRKRYREFQLKCETALKSGDLRQKMIVIDTFIHMTHKGGLFGNKLIKDFDVFKQMLKELEQRYGKEVVE